MWYIGYVQFRLVMFDCDMLRSEDRLSHPDDSSPISLHSVTISYDLGAVLCIQATLRGSLQVVRGGAEHCVSARAPCI